MLQVFIISIFLVGFAFIAIGVNVIFTKRAFPETEVGQNKKMKQMGIECAKCGEWRKHKERMRFREVSIDFSKLSL